MAEIVELEKIVNRDGMTAVLTKARKYFDCHICHEVIEKGTYYYSVTFNGAGLGSLKFPDRVCLSDLDTYFEKHKH